MGATLAELEAQVSAMKAQRQRDREPTNPAAVIGTPGNPAPAPYVTSGPVGQSSRRMSLVNGLVNFISGVDPSKAKTEGEFFTRLKACYEKAHYGWMGPEGSNSRTFYLPLDFATVPDAVMEYPEAKWCKAVADASFFTPEPDRDELEWRRKKGQVTAATVKAMSGYFDSLGGTLVAPEIQGEVIPLIRPTAAFLAAGAQSVTLPPQGRLVRPRVIAAPNVQAISEGNEVDPSDLQTGELVLTAKKIVGATKVSEEFTSFTSGTGDAIVQMELGRSLGLKIDAYAFNGNGGTNIPQGITNAAYAGQVTNFETAYPGSRAVGANGNTLLPQLGDDIPAIIGEKSFGVDPAQGTWVMRPGSYASAVGARASAVTPGDQQGPKVDIVRRFDERGPSTWAGRRVVQTTNILTNQTKGQGTGLQQVFYGLFQYGILASYGALMFTQGTVNTDFLKGLLAIRGVLWGDVGLEYPGAFLSFPNVIPFSNM